MSKVCVDIPVLETERLTLRAPTMGDFEAVADFLASDRSTGVGGPKIRYEAWQSFSAIIGHWHLHGHGLWAVDERASGRYVGQIGLWNPEGWIAPEVGWWITDPTAEGKGFAHEAALRSRQYAYETVGWTQAFSVIAPGNDRSIALAKRLGCVLDREEVWKGDKTALVFRHPAPEDCA